MTPNIFARRPGLWTGVALAVVAVLYFGRGAGQTDLIGLGLGFISIALLAIVSTRQACAGRSYWLAGTAIACVAAWRGAAARQELLWLNLIEYLVINGLLAIEFGRSLLPGREPLCTLFARLADSSLSAAVVSYTRHVTLAWTIFFVVLMTCAVGLFTADLPRIWMAYADIATPILVLAMFAIEYGVRCLVLAPDERMDIASAMRGYRASLDQPSRPTPVLATSSAGSP